MSTKKLLLLAVTIGIVLAGSVNAEFTVDAGTDMVTWLGQPVALDPNVLDADDPNLPATGVTYAWSTSPLPTGVTVDFDPGTDVEAPTVTINGPETPEFVAVEVPNPGFEIRMDPIYEGTGNWIADGENRYVQGLIDFWRHYDYIGNGGPVRLLNPVAADFTGDPDAPEGELVVLVITRRNDPDYPLEIRDSEAAVQLLDEKFDPSIDYKLTVKVGNPAGADYFRGNPVHYNGYAVQLLAGGENYDGAAFGYGVTGGTVIAEDYNSQPVAEGAFVESTVMYTADSASADLAGLPLQIRLVALEDPQDHSTYSFVAFDDVKLYAKRLKIELTLAVDDAITPLAEPLTDSMTIDVYKDACKAVFYNDRSGLDISDFDADCVTEIDDLAVLAINWLNDYKLTAAIDK